MKKLMERTWLCVDARQALITKEISPSKNRGSTEKVKPVIGPKVKRDYGYLKIEL